MAYGQLESEAEQETDKVPYLEWPDKGMIELHNVRFKYGIDYPYVLKLISFKIDPCEKVGNYTLQCHNALCTRYVGWYCG